MKKILTLLFVFSIFTLSSIIAQNTPSHKVCGTSVEDLQTIFERMKENRARFGNNIQMRAVAYIPVALHLVAKSDGTGRISEAKVLDYLALVNATYAANGLEMQFYIKYINYINNDDIYDKPNTFVGINRTATQKKPDALNILFVNTVIEVSSIGTVVGRYVPAITNIAYSADWITIKNAVVGTGFSSTLEHELGHFFSLNHTFYGFDEEAFKPTAASPCAPLTMTLSNGKIITTENVARTGADANCTTAGDGFCDTPAEYQLGFGVSNCTYTGLAKDAKCVAVDPDETNIMSYFDERCTNKFSTEQKNAIRNDYLNNAARRYLRDGNMTPALVDMVAPTLQVPADNATTSSYTNLNFDWADVNGVIPNEANNASGYIFDISSSSSFNFNALSFRVPSSNFNLLSSNVPANFLQPNKKYFWRVRPYGTYKTAYTNATPFAFFTGTLNAVKDITGIENFSISPNPVLDAKTVNINLTSARAMEGVVKIQDLTGKVLLCQKMFFETGFNAKILDITILAKGLYVLTIEADKGVLNKKVVITDN
jgi:hypothetical protein